MNKISIEGVITTSMSHDELSKKLIAWLEENECEFFGMTDEMEDEESEIPRLRN